MLYKLQIMQRKTLFDYFKPLMIYPDTPSTHPQRTMLSAPPLDASASYQVSTALKELSEFLVTPSARDTKNRQKLLRNLRVGHQESLTYFLMKWRLYCIYVCVSIQVLELVMEVLKLYKQDTDDAR